MGEKRNYLSIVVITTVFSLVGVRTHIMNVLTWNCEKVSQSESVSESDECSSSTQSSERVVWCCNPTIELEGLKHTIARNIEVLIWLRFLMNMLFHSLSCVVKGFHKELNFPRADRPGSYQMQITICHKNPLIVNHNFNLASQLCDMQLIEWYIFNMCRHVASNYQNPPCQEFYRYFGLKNSLKSDFWAFSFKPGGAYLQPSELECPQIQFEWMQFVVTPATKLK